MIKGIHRFEFLAKGDMLYLVDRTDESLSFWQYNGYHQSLGVRSYTSIWLRPEKDMSLASYVKIYRYTRTQWLIAAKDGWREAFLTDIYESIRSSGNGKLNIYKYVVLDNEELLRFYVL